MSTDGSDTSSQIRQFGLYRTIDAKTEEFLKLSKKRQIKQGCVCAAISTLITVAVVISIVLIYEYSLIHDSKPNEKRPNLLSSMNNSLETLPFEVKFSKEKLDPAVVQLLPLILKTLKQNIDLDKIVDDSSSLSPYVKKGTEDSAIITPARQNLLRSPSSRLYTIEYKTFPILYFRNPKRNIEQFTKIRKIRDYQRIMNYVNKMISHRVSIATAIPMAKYIYGTYKTNNKEYTTPMISVENHKSNKKNMQLKKTKTTSTQTVQSNCQCSEKLSDLFSKFMGRLKTLVPYLTGKRHNDSTLCNHNKQKTTENVYNNATTGNKTFSFTSSHDLSTATPKINNEYTSYTPQIHIEHTLYNSGNRFQSQDDTMHDLPKLINPNEGIKLTEGNDYTYERFETKQYFDEISNRSNINAISLTPIVSTQVTPLRESKTIVIDNGKPMSSSNPGISELPVSISTVYKNYTNLNIIDYFKMLDAHSLELVNKKIIPNRNKIELSKDIHNENSIENTIDNASLASKDNNIDLLNNNENVSNIINVEPSTSSTLTTHPPTNEYFTENKSLSTINTTIIDYNIRTENLLNNIKIYPTSRSDDLTLEEEIERAPLDDSDTNVKNLENMITKLNNTYEYMNNNNNEASEYDWELVKIKEDKYTNSMIPQSRSSYLEIQRGYWKKEEHNDYDNKLNHYNLLNL